MSDVLFFAGLMASWPFVPGFWTGKLDAKAVNMGITGNDILAARLAMILDVIIIVAIIVSPIGPRIVGDLAFMLFGIH